MPNFKTLKLQQVLQKKREEAKKIKDWNNSKQGKEFYNTLKKKVNESLELQKTLKNNLPF